MEKEIHIKMIVCGNSQVGKTSFLNKICYNRTIDLKNNITIGIDYFVYNYIDNELKTKVKFGIWDSGGLDCFQYLLQTYFKNTLVLFAFYDINDRESFDNLDKWINEYNKCSIDKKYIFIIGCKKDIGRRQVFYNEGLEYSKKYNSFFYEISNYEDNNKLNIIFKDLVKTILDDYNHNKSFLQNKDYFRVKYLTNIYKENDIKKIKKKKCIIS